MNTINLLEFHPNFENYNLVIYYLALVEDRFDLYFKMTGENIQAYRDLNEIRNYLGAILNEGSMNEQFIPLNPDGITIQNCHYRAAVCIITGFDCPSLRITVGNPSNWRCDKKWLEENYNKREVKEIEEKRVALIKNYRSSH